jgi:hypothetical protein
MSSFLQNHRGAVALNNMGVTLLERCCYRDAMKNFKDGLNLIKGSADEREREESLRRSSQCVASSTSSPTDAPAKFELTVLTHDDSSMGALTAALHEFQSSGSGMVLRLDWNDDEEDETEAEIYCTATMFHNYSVACRMQTLDCKSRSVAQKLRMLATKSAVVAHASLDNVHSQRNLTLLMLNLQQLMQLASADGDKDKACKYYCEMAFLRTRLEDHQEEFTSPFELGERAAAAA